MPHPCRHSRPGWMWLWVCWLGTHSFLGQPVPVRHHPLGEKLPPHIQPKPPLSQFKTIPHCPITIHPRKQPFPSCLYAPLKYCKGIPEKLQMQEGSVCIFLSERMCKKLLKVESLKTLFPNLGLLVSTGHDANQPTSYRHKRETL